MYLQDRKYFGKKGPVPNPDSDRFNKKYWLKIQEQKGAYEVPMNEIRHFCIK
jgi:hypothetical protein